MNIWNTVFGCDHADLPELNILQQYNVFKIPKSKGKTRTIEAPCKPLKHLQRRIALYLQERYKTVLPNNVHGYIPNDELRGIHRSIITNAQQHLSSNYMLNVDLKDFFHQVTCSKLDKLYKEEWLEIDDQEVRQLLLALTTFKNRLPMGAPTSPVLSNLAFLKCDRELVLYSQAKGLKYTRYVDDLSFSSVQRLPQTILEDISQIILQAGFSLNMKKTKLFGYSDNKIVTGLMVGQQKITLAPDYETKVKINIKALQKLKRMRNTVKYFNIAFEKNTKLKLKEIERSVNAQIHFVERIEGAHSPIVKSLKKLKKKPTDLTHDFDLNIYI